MNVPESLAGVGLTAVGVAMIRARETERADRLLADPYAAAFAEAARREFASSAQSWAMVERLVDSFYEGRVIAVRLVDDLLREGVAAGCTQVVQLGAGLDTRAFRMALPDTVRMFEVDLPKVFAFKEPVLGSATPTCVRHVVRADLRADWRTPLLAEGFDREAPTLWVEEGALAYLPRADAHAVVTTLSALSAPGSRLTFGQIQLDETQSHYRELRKLVPYEEQTPARGLGPDLSDWLRRHGWLTEFRGWNELAAALERAARVEDPHNGFLLAVRKTDAE